MLTICQASITCLVQNGDIPTYFNLSTTYDYLSPTFTGNGDETLFNQLDSQNKAALWWGQSLLSVHIFQLEPSSTNTKSQIVELHQPCIRA